MNVLVTGGSGIIGAAAIPALLRAGHKVRLLSRHADEEVRSFPEGVQAFVADIAVPETLNGAIDGCECVLHVAGIAEENPPESTFEGINVAGTRHLIAAAKRTGLPYFIYVSSLGAERGNSEYQKSKIRAEELVRSYHGPWLVLRPGNVYGPGDETISMLLKMVRSLPAVPMVARGDQPFQPLWHCDFAEVIPQVVERRELSGETLELAGPDVTTTDDILHRLGEITGRKVPRMSVPVWVTEVGVQMLEAFGATGKKLLRRAGMDAPITSAKLDMLLEENVIPRGGRNALLDFVAEPTSLQDGLEMLADYLPEQLPGDGVGAGPPRQRHALAKQHHGRG
jgi:NADH dehydrogenase